MHGLLSDRFLRMFTVWYKPQNDPIDTEHPQIKTGKNGKSKTLTTQNPTRNNPHQDDTHDDFSRIEKNKP